MSLATICKWHDRLSELFFNTVWVIVLFLPFQLIMAFVKLSIAWQQRRFWRRMHERGQAARWPEVEAKLARGLGTLLIQAFPKGPSELAWWLEDGHDVVDPGYVIPSLADYEARGYRVFDGSDRDAMDRWSLGSLKRYEHSAHVVVTSMKNLLGLDPEVKRNSVLVCDELCEYTLFGHRM